MTHRRQIFHLTALVHNRQDQSILDYPFRTSSLTKTPNTKSHHRNDKIHFRRKLYYASCVSDSVGSKVTRRDQIVRLLSSATEAHFDRTIENPLSPLPLPLRECRYTHTCNHAKAFARFNSRLLSRRRALMAFCPSLPPTQIHTTPYYRQCLQHHSTLWMSLSLRLLAQFGKARYLSARSTPCVHDCVSYRMRRTVGAVGIVQCSTHSL